MAEQEPREIKGPFKRLRRWLASTPTDEDIFGRERQAGQPRTLGQSVREGLTNAYRNDPHIIIPDWLRQIQQQVEREAARKALLGEPQRQSWWDRIRRRSR